MLPGTPQIQNVIPAGFYGTTIWAAPFLGITAAVIQFAVGMLWLNHRRKTAQTWGEGYGEGNSAAHIKAGLMGSSVQVLVENGRLQLGTWQAIYFCEFDGPRTHLVWIG